MDMRQPEVSGATAELTHEGIIGFNLHHETRGRPKKEFILKREPKYIINMLEANVLRKLKREEELLEKLENTINEQIQFR
jgi:predicted transcriptional regulator